MDHITNEKLSNEEYIIRQLINRISNLDKEVVTKRRTEQYLLKKYLFQEKEYGNCAICNEDFPVKFLATAHIKKRSECNDEEKRDLNIVMPTCYLGCDKLYEDGYIVVEEGIIKQNIKNKPSSKKIEKYLATIDSMECTYFKEETQLYFKHQRDKYV